jgi:hypothetical protein
VPARTVLAMTTNTRVTLRYTDASNYKRESVVIFSGEATAEDRQLIADNYYEGEFFLPSQVGLTPINTQWSTHFEDDHIWHTITDIEPSALPPTQPETMRQFAEKFRDICWDVAAAHSALEDFKETTPAGK